MVSLADSVSHRARFAWLGAALATALAMFIATRPSTTQPRHRGLSLGRCAEHVVRAPLRTDQVHVYTGLMVGRMGEEPYLHLMENVVTSTLAKRAPRWIVESTVTANETAGFSISGTLESLTVEPQPDLALVTCKVTLVLTSYPEQHELQRISLEASLNSGNAPIEQEIGRRDCVTALAEDITARELIPSIASRL
jgi:hypothetical protein